MATSYCSSVEFNVSFLLAKADRDTVRPRQECSEKFGQVLHTNVPHSPVFSLVSQQGALFKLPKISHHPSINEFKDKCGGFCDIQQCSVVAFYL